MTITTADIEGFEAEAGGHRIQRIPYNEKHKRVHSSTVTVSVFGGNDTAEIPCFCDDDFEISFHRSTGSGGQRKNKVATCCVVKHIPSGMTQKADGRSRNDNSKNALKAIKDRLLALHSERELKLMNKVRSSQIGSGARSDKTRTYRFQDNLVSDHVTGKQTSCKDFMRGNIDKLWK